MTAMTSPRRQMQIKFIVLLGIVLGYFVYLWIRFDAATGAMAAALTWSFFVLCTPVADAGFLLDFPLRLLFGIRMVVSELAVWVLAGMINTLALIFAPTYYDTTLLTRLLKQILLQPWPYWGVIVLSGLGTFLSVKFGDELMDVLHHRERDFFHSHQFKHELIMIAFFAVILVAYYELIATLGLEGVL